MEKRRRVGKIMLSRYVLFKEVGEGDEEEQGYNVPVHWINKFAYPHVESSTRNDMEPGVPELQGQHGHVKLHSLGHTTYLLPIYSSA